MNREQKQFDDNAHLTDVTAKSTTYGRRAGQSANETQSLAEGLLQIGRRAQFLLQHGANPRDAAGELGISENLSSLAVSFAKAPDLLKMRAMIEDWSPAEIVRQLIGLAG